MGNTTRTTVPSPGAVSMVSCPPCAATIAATMGRPRPDPGRDRLRSPRQKRSKAWAALSRSMPSPVSVTSRTAASTRPVARTVTEALAGVWMRAFVTRLATT